MIFRLIVIVLFILLLGFLIKYLLSKKLLLDTFNAGNTLTFGKMGKGKDLIIQFVINHRKDKVYFSNQNYGNKYNHIDIKDLELFPNTFENFINGNPIQVKKNEKLEGHDVYFSDGGIYLPSQYDHLLHKKYPSLPIYYALSRQLYNGHFHMNSQALDRPWKALREQADSYIKALKTIKLPFILITKFYVYDRYSTALQGVEPFKPHKHGLIRDKELTDIEKAKFKAIYGEVKEGFIIQLKKKIYYDTRYFHKIIFGREFTRSAVTSREGWSVTKIFKKKKKKKEKAESESA